MYASKNPGFPEAYRPWMVLIFIAHIEGTLIHLYTKKNQKTNFFGSGKEGVPLIV